MTQRTPLPDKLFFKIGEVADLVGVRAHVLRYWETEFPSLRPMKTRGAHRVYRKRDVELAMLIRRLLHDEGFTLPGARKRLRELGHERDESEAVRAATREVALRAELLAVRDDLLGLLAAIDRVAAHDTLVGAPAPAPAAAGAAPARVASELPRAPAAVADRRPPAAAPATRATPTAAARATPTAATAAPASPAAASAARATPIAFEAQAPSTKSAPAPARRPWPGRV